MRILSFLSIIITISSTISATSRHDAALAKARAGSASHSKRGIPGRNSATNVKPGSMAQTSSTKAYHPSKQEFNALKAKVAKQKNSTTSNPLVGVVAAFTNPSGFVGYAALELTSQFHTTPLTGDLSKAAVVTLPSANPSANFELSVANAAQPFLGEIYGFQGSDFGPGKPGYGTMTVVQHSTWPATNTNNPNGDPSESGIWNINLSTNELTAVWFDDDGTEVDTTIFLDATFGDLNFGGDLTAYASVYPGYPFHVTTLYFVPFSYFGL